MAGIDFIHQNGVDYEIVPEIAPRFKTTVSYHTGDHVIYEAGWYTFKADKSAGAWDATKVDGPFKVSERLIDLRQDLNRATDSLNKATFSSVSRTSYGVTFSVSNNTLIAYGTATASRRLICLNGNNAVKASGDSFVKTLDAGKYKIVTSISGNVSANLVSWQYTYDTFANGVGVVNKINTEAVVEFTAPVMIGFLFQTNANFGTESSPTYITLSITQLTAVDLIARKENGRLDSLIDALNVTGVFDYSNINAADLTGYGISPENNWSSSSIQKSYTFKIPPNIKSIHVKANVNGSRIAFLNSYTPQAGVSVDLSTQYNSRIDLAANEEQDFVIAGNMNYLFAFVKSSSSVDEKPILTITATNNVLEPVDIEDADESSMHDRKTEIFAMLNTYGECKLAKGIYYVSNSLYMPIGSKLIGAGIGTIVKLLASVISGSTIVMGANCAVKDLTIKGSDVTKWEEVSEGTRNGIEWTGETQVAGTVDNCMVLNFSGSGIYLHDTTQKTYRNLSIINCYITGNYIGVDIRKNSEFNKIANCTIIGNSVGYRNRGGNNDLANSGLDANKTGVLIDEDVGSNGGHGTITGCSINHSGNNNGYGLIIKDTGRMLVTNCNLYYSKLKLDTTNGNVISNCGFGASSSWEITGGECSIFIGCMTRGWDSDNSLVVVTSNTDVKIINCYDRNGVAYEDYSP